MVTQILSKVNFCTGIKCRCKKRLTFAFACAIIVAVRYLADFQITKGDVFMSVVFKVVTY